MKACPWALSSIAMLCAVAAVAATNDPAADADASASLVGKIVGPMPLYEGEIPNSRPSLDKEVHKQTENNMDWVTQVSRPSYTVYLPPLSRASGAAMLIFPGGGYEGLSLGMEGRWIAGALQDRGIAGVVVKYRLPSSETMTDKSIGPLQDAQQALLQVRRHAAEWRVDPQKVGAIGFSAGGHLASTLGTLFDKAVVPNPDNLSLRPNCLILVYPATNMSAITSKSDEDLRHFKETLLGKSPSAELVERFSPELQVTDRTPPTLLLVAGNDTLADDSINLYLALRRHNVPAELVVFERGSHGFWELIRDDWMDPMWAWLRRNEWTRH